MNKNAAAPEKAEPKEAKATPMGSYYEIVEMLGLVTILVMMIFAFVVRLNIVDGDSMNMTLQNKEYLAVSDLFYTPKRGDIVIVHKLDAGPYAKPIVKRVIATGGQTVDIDFATWTLTVDGEVVEEPYRYLSDRPLLTAEYSFPITVPEGEVFVMGDNRNGSADSRQIEIRTIDERCIVGRALCRLTPLSRMTVFRNPFGE